MLQTGDGLLAVWNMCAWTEIGMLKERGVDSVTRLNINRKADFRRGRRLGKGDQIGQWPKPTKPRAIDAKSYASLPDTITVRECRVQGEQPGFRAKLIMTTLLDADEITQGESANLDRRRWNAELDLRSLKCGMKMDILRCKTPELVRKEIWTHILAYILIRTIMAQAAAKHDIEPRSIRLKGAVQTLEAFHPLVAITGASTPNTE